MARKGFRLNSDLLKKHWETLRSSLQKTRPETQSKQTTQPDRSTSVREQTPTRPPDSRAFRAAAGQLQQAGARMSGNASHAQPLAPGDQRSWVEREQARQSGSGNQQARGRSLGGEHSPGHAAGQAQTNTAHAINRLQLDQHNRNQAFGDAQDATTARLSPQMQARMENLSQDQRAAAIEVGKTIRERYVNQQARTQEKPKEKTQDKTRGGDER